MTLLPIPSHLPAWQAPHLAWLASQGKPTRYAVPKGTKPVQAVLEKADLGWADLRGADLSWADLSGAVLHTSDLFFANLRSAVLRDANLMGADLSGANLSEACLVGAKMTHAYIANANLCGAYLCATDLHDAYGISHIGPVGRRSCTVYAVSHDNGPMIRADDWWGSPADIIPRIEADYADDPVARDRYIAAVRAVAALVMP